MLPGSNKISDGSVGLLLLLLRWEEGVLERCGGVMEGKGGVVERMECSWDLRRRRRLCVELAAVDTLPSDRFLVKFTMLNTAWEGGGGNTTPGTTSGKHVDSRSALDKADVAAKTVRRCSAVAVVVDVLESVPDTGARRA